MGARVRIQVRGIVQGVGFRPFIFSLANSQSLKGHVFNNSSGVLIDIEGDSSSIDRFLDQIKSNPPPLSIIESVERTDYLAPAYYSDFRILDSISSDQKFIPISADVGTCEDCLTELFDAANRRYLYPFINCTNCGPRFTIIENLPYDRSLTSMRHFEMCDDCRAEYLDPSDRRFHAEPTACPACGPRLSLTDSAGRDLTAGDPIAVVRSLLLDGEIIAIKGIGGFHLACDATNADAVERLRQRKRRPARPFALMAASLDVISRHCLVSELEQQLLLSHRRPIVLLDKRPGSSICRGVSPGLLSLGFMLPYAPLHHLLFHNLDRPLVFTSANLSDEPICFDNQEALDRLSRIADFFLLHDRIIHMRTDDSLVRVFSGRRMSLRRARGFAPEPLKTSFSFQSQILACGAELKNTFCITRDSFAFISHHIGDLENLETFTSFKDAIDHFKRLFNLNPEAVAHDLHPEYLSTKYALSLDEELIKVGVQHHHAHIASCMVDNDLEGEVVGVAMDGLGFGEDGRLWGGEFFVADFLEAERIAHLDYIEMPGGAKAIREPWRMAAIYLHRTLGDEFLDLGIDFIERLDRRAWGLLRQMARSSTNSPETSSMGRLMDAVSSLVGLRDRISYEGQAAIELEAIAEPGCSLAYEFELSEGGSIIKAEPVIRRAVEDLLDGASAASVSAKFHIGVVNLIVRVAQRIREERRLDRVVLSGGVFQNMLLLEKSCQRLKGEGFEVFTHSRVPTSDGGISLGQAAVANARIKAGKV
jgi:hydrogenase maturation protein HypF